MNNPERRAALPGRVDAHQHFWRPARGDYGWLRPDVPALAPICRDVAPAELAPLLAAHGISHTVLVQAAPTAAETDFLLGLAREHAFIAGVVGWVDVTRADSVATLERWAATAPALKSLRPMLQDLPEDDWIAHAPHPDVLAALPRLGLAFDALVKPWHLPALRSFVRANPKLPVVIDHGAKPVLSEGWASPWVEAWRHGLAALADEPTVACKFSGLLTEASPAQCADPVATLRPVWDTLLEAFGPERLIWGSDWPVLTLAAPYDRWVAAAEALIGELSPDEQAAVWGGNARRFYNL